MSNDYTLPPVPHMIAYTPQELERIRDYGHACAEHARAPLAEENARLLWQIAGLEDDLREARAEVEAKDAANAALRDCLRDCADDLETEVNARASGELPRRIERDLEPVRKARALLAQRGEGD